MRPVICDPFGGVIRWLLYPTMWQSVLVEGLSSLWLAGGAHTSHWLLLRLPSVSRAGVGANSAWITHRSMKMIVKAHQGSNGMNVKSTNTEMVAIRIPSQRGYAAQVLALVVIQ